MRQDTQQKGWKIDCHFSLQDISALEKKIEKKTEKKEKLLEDLEANMSSITEIVNRR